MNNYTSFAFVILLFIPFILFVPELSIYGVQTTKANTIVEQVTKKAELVGGVTPEVESYYLELLKESGLDPDIFKLKVSKKGILAHKEKFSVQIKGYYTFKTFNILGTGLGNVNYTITRTDSGINEVFVR